MATSKFGQAFADARKSGLKTFEFGGKKYNTKLSEEVEQPSLGRVKAGEYTPRDSIEQRGNRATSTSYVPRDAMEQRGNRATSDNYSTRAGLGAGAGRGGQGGPSAEDLENMKKGGSAKYAKGGVTRADGCITKGHTKGRMV
jgi:hypothetical protein